MDFLPRIDKKDIFCNGARVQSLINPEVDSESAALDLLQQLKEGTVTVNDLMVN